MSTSTQSTSGPLRRFQLKPRCTRFLVFLVLAALLAPYGKTSAQDTASRLPSSGALSFVLDAGEYTLSKSDDGETTISIGQDFGSLGESGEPQLPSRVYMFALPPMVEVTTVVFDTPDVSCLPDPYNLAANKPLTTPGEDLEAVENEWEQAKQKAYEGGNLYGQNAGEYLGMGQWRRYAIGQIAYTPFSYEPGSGRLCYRPSLHITVQYQARQTPDSIEEYAALSTDTILDDMIADELVNFDETVNWYESPQATESMEAQRSDYVIIVQNDTVAQHLVPLQNWKQSLGHRVRIVTLDWIQPRYGGVDVAEQVWNFLHAMYPSSAWGIRYVLLVGDMSVMPTRRLFYDDTGWGLVSDHYFAKLSGGATSAAVWNRDGDTRWGELDDDGLTVAPDVLVGRIPLNDVSAIDRAVSASIRFEQDTGDWKRSALLAGGYLDIESAQRKTDTAVPLEKTRLEILEPFGWSTSRIYEQTGLGTNSYTPPPDYDTNPYNVVKDWNGRGYSLVVLADHAWPGGLAGRVWISDPNGSGKAEKGELEDQVMFWREDASQIVNPKPAIVALWGCESIGMVNPPAADSSFTPITEYWPNTGSALMGQGAAASAVGFYSAVGYMPYWRRLEDGGVSTFGYYFTENLVSNHLSVGWALFAAKLRYTQSFWHNDYSPFHWAANLYGDPSLALEGYDLSAKYNDRTIHAGPLRAYGYGADNDDNGDMYVAVVDTPRSVVVYRSTDHGQTWPRWARFAHSSDITSVDVLVARWRGIPLGNLAYVHVFLTDAGARAWDYRITLAPSDSTSEPLVAQEEIAQQEIAQEADARAPDVLRAGRIAVARDPVAMPSTFRIYVTWEVSSGDHAQVKLAMSSSNGNSWSSAVTFDDRTAPRIDAGPNGRVYLVAQSPSGSRDVQLNRSENYGQNWRGWKNLTSDDGAANHAFPIVAVSTDPAVPTVWVAYSRIERSANGPEYISIRMAFSKNAGINWVSNRILSSEPGLSETMPHMAGYRSGPNRWMNIVYRRSTTTSEMVVWRWASGLAPMNWSAQRPIGSDQTYGGIGPRIVYSPGASRPGSGVIHAITGPSGDELRFSAPWL